MSKSGPIVIVEDDADDREFLGIVFKKLEIKNEIIWCENTDEALEQLSKKAQNAFIILCDINLPGKNGLEFKRSIDSDPFLRKKSIPFIFYSTSAHQSHVNEAYSEMTIQGFFKKATSLSETIDLMKLILGYWTVCKHPNN
ncbi:MAG TPA: response regulator [Flavobacterium sp.]|nr:response regulator [Flavobacterium sp.]